MEKEINKKEKKIAVLLDGPNILRNEFNFVGLEDIQEAIKQYGKIYVKRAYLSHHATEHPKLIEYVFNQGFEPRIGLSDIDTLLTADAVEFIIKENIDMIAVVSRDSSFLPIFYKAKKYKKESLAVYVSSNEGNCSSLKNIADYSIDMRMYIERKKKQMNKGNLEEIVNKSKKMKR